MNLSIIGRVVIVATVFLPGPGRLLAQTPPEPGLLFYLSGDRVEADHAASGEVSPNFLSGIKVIEDGAHGKALECAHTQLYSFRAPGNIHAQRGTLSFFWRPREPVGPTAFPVFRVGYADHSSWDMVWLRIDYNGKPGFDAFVTDASLARTRVSHALPAAPDPKTWVHLALTWDETTGIRFYVNGTLAAKQDGVAVFDAALDQFGPHSRIISPYQVQSRYNFIRGGDIDELRIYDRMLADEHIATLARGEAPTSVPPLERALTTPRWQQEWWLRYGWNRPGDAPPALEGEATAIRKVEIHDVFDIKRWWWKGTDGIRETTWPGVYNWSRLPGRNDYFQLPDWDCYSISGRRVTFKLPDEPWNHLEVSGAAFGQFGIVDGNSLPVDDEAPERALFTRPQGQERTFHRLAEPMRGRLLRFTNVEPETPIGELAAYHVAPGKEPAGIATLAYRLSATPPTQPGTEALVHYINGRHPADERAMMVALPPGMGPTPAASGAVPAAPTASHVLPLVHIVIPADFRDAPRGRARAMRTYSWGNMAGGLDGIALDLPALNVAPTHGEYFPLNIQVRDPIWPLRVMLDVNVSVKPGEPHTLWLDTRDRILPNNRNLYLVIAGAGSGFGPAALDGAELRLIFKPRNHAHAEHVLDRFTQVRDSYAMLVEESPRTRRLDLYTRFEADITDLFRADPEHVRGRQYWYDANREQPRPPFTLATPPEGVPLWAFRQVELVGYVKRFVNWYIDHRQIANGEFGGGLSDDGDLTNWWPGTAFMGSTPEKILASLRLHMEAFYDQGLFTNGLSTIQTDELHSYEEGIQVLGQLMLLDFGNPLYIERAWETARALETLTGVNKAGHRHLRSSYFSGSKMALEGVWGWSKPQGHLLLHPVIALVDYNGAPGPKRILLELADSVLAHRKAGADGSMGLRGAVHFESDEDEVDGNERLFYHLLWAAYRWTGQQKYLQPMLDAAPSSAMTVTASLADHVRSREAWAPKLLATERPADDGWRHLAWQWTGEARWLESLYTDQVADAAVREYINTEGSLWIDRVNVPHGEVQRARLGGVALLRNSYVPGHVVSWQFAGHEDEKVAILVSEAAPGLVRLRAYNLHSAPVKARLTAWNIDPGRWMVVQGTAPDTVAPPAATTTRQLDLERSTGFDVEFAPRTVTTLDLRLVSKGTPYWSRPDLGLSAHDIKVEGSTMTVTVHSVGAKATPRARVVVTDATGAVLGDAAVPALGAALSPTPVTTMVRVPLQAGADLGGARVEIVPSGSTREITTRNNAVTLE